MHRRGRFEKAMDPSASKYISSMDADFKIFSSVVQVNIAHVLMLAERKIIAEQDAAAILRALIDLQHKGLELLELRPELEDIHMAVEEFVSKATSEEIGGKLHTAKSRNDQVTAAIRLTLRKEMSSVESAFLELTNALITLAENNVDTIMPGYTHLQVAEPTTFGHVLAAYCSAFLRDVERLDQAYECINSCPMGACALAGTSFPIDRARVAHLLGFRRVDENTIDAVSSRDFALQAMSALTIAMVNVSRLAEELSLWSSAEFDMIEMPDEFSSPSSIMPQKKNPVVAEMARAKTAHVLGNLAGALAMMKALPQAYNLDLQELTPLLWSSVDDARESAEAMAKLISAVKPKQEAMRKRAESNFAVATELADTLVRKAGLNFRESHAIVGRMVAEATEKGRVAADMNLEDLRVASKEILGKEVSISQEELEEALDIAKCIAARELPGGPAPKAVKDQLKSFKGKAKNYSKLMSARKRAIGKSEVKLLKEAQGRCR
jgi:argininosuccinate lyase